MSRSNVPTLARLRALVEAEYARLVSHLAEIDREVDSLGLEARSNPQVELEYLERTNQTRHAIAETEAALRRMAEGTYGVCESCGAAIPTARLEAIPGTSLCVGCQARVESGAPLMNAV